VIPLVCYAKWYVIEDSSGDRDYALSLLLLGSKYVPPHLRNSSSGGGSSSGYSGGRGSGGGGYQPRYSGGGGGRGYNGRGGQRGYNDGGTATSSVTSSDTGGDFAPAPPVPVNSRWSEVDTGSGGYGRNSGGYGGGYGGGGGRGAGGSGRGGGGGRGYSGGFGAPVNARGYHGDLGTDPRVEARLFDNSEKQTTGINFDNYDKIPIEVSGDNVPDPIDHFTEETVGADLCRNAVLCGYSKPTPVQKYSIPIAMHQRDLMACAQTGR
jgi:ATP-dependent RNA helicase DDX3X